MNTACNLAPATASKTADQTYDNLVFLDLEPPQIDAQQCIIHWLRRDIISPPARLLYDEAGAQLFEAICNTPEYYLTQSETAILPHLPAQIAGEVHDRAQIVEYGSGNNQKIIQLLNALPQIKAHVPIDISKDHLLANASQLAAQHPERRFTAICADFFQDFDLPVRPNGIPITQNIGFFPGSTIGNMPQKDAEAFLAKARRALGPDSLFLLAVDRVKDPAILEAAYMDQGGFSARFSLNLIDRINREMAGTLKKNKFTYKALYNAADEAIEMRWIVVESHSATIGSETLQFKEGDSFLVEISRKFTRESVSRLANNAGYNVVDIVSDSKEWFSLAVLKA
jgi:dimethylhistidine N-methyltransferase